MLHYAVRDIKVRCTAYNIDQYQKCKFGRTDFDNRCLYKRLDGECESPDALAELAEEPLTGGTNDDCCG